MRHVIYLGGINPIALLHHTPMEGSYAAPQTREGAVYAAGYYLDCDARALDTVAADDIVDRRGNHAS
jgi:hypothetical protein